MRIVVVFLMIVTFCFSNAFEEGKRYVAQNDQEISLDATGFIPSDSPKEASLYDTNALENKIKKESQSNKTFQQIRKVQRERVPIEVEVIIPEIEGVSLDNGKLEFERARESQDERDEFITENCHTSGESYPRSCQRQLSMNLVVTPAVYRQEWYCPNGGTHSICTSRTDCDRDYYEYSCFGCEEKKSCVTPKKVTITQEEWQGCEEFEAMRDRGEAEVISETPGPYNETRQIQGESIQREYFETTRVYALNTQKINTCTPLKALGCQRLSSRCIEEKILEEGPKICLKHEHLYQCRKETSLRGEFPSKFGISIPKAPPVIANQNMMKALSQLEALKQTASLKTQEGSQITFLKGDMMSCTTNFGGSFKDCCRSEGGFGTNIGLATGCTPSELTLQKAKREGRCVFIGARSKNKVLGINFSKEYGYCCFQSQLVFAIQEGARKQLGKDFGSLQDPQCNGLTGDELQRVDFGQLDLSETFENIMTSATHMQKTVKTHLTHAQKRFKEASRDKYKQTQEVNFDEKTY